MPRSRFTRLLIRGSLGLALVCACSAMTTPARAGFDQLWYLGAKNAGTVYNSDNGTLPYNSSIMSQNVNTGTDEACIDAEGATAANGTPVIVYACANEHMYPNPWNQRWINSRGWCPGFDADHPAPINIYGKDLAIARGCGQGAGVTWFSMAVGDNWGACIDVPGGDDANGQGLQIYECNGTPAQVWRAGVPGYGESPLWIRSNITDQGVNRCMTNWGRVVLYDCAYDF
jgi:hypothetical protein